MLHWRFGLVAALTAASLTAACGGGGGGDDVASGGGGGGGAGAGASGGAVASTNTASPGCIASDDPIVELAKKEGAVVMSGPPDKNVRRDLPAAFEEAYGVKLEYIGARGSEIAAKLRSEREAGIYSQDVFVGGGDTMTNVYYESGWLQSLKELIPPEALEGSNYVLGETPWVDDPTKDKILKLSQYVSLPYVVNTNLVKEGEVKTWKDLLNPKWRGKIVMDDPTTSGGGANDVGMFSEAYGEDFLRQLYVDQKPVFLKDSRQEIDDIGKGKFAIGLSINQSDVDSGVKDGLPLKVVVPEGGPLAVTSGFGLLAVADKTPHPNGAKLLASWLACKDGNAAWNKAYNTFSVRSDVPAPADVPDYQRIEKGQNYFDTYSWEFLTKGKRESKNKIKALLGG